MSMEHLIKDGQIADLLEDYIELSKVINAIPKELEESLSKIELAVSILPKQLDSMLQVKINAISEAATEAEDEAKKVIAGLVSDIRIEGEKEKDIILKNLYLRFNEEVTSFHTQMNNGLSKINEASVKLGAISKTKDASILPVLIVGIVCAVLSLGGGILGTKLSSHSTNNEVYELKRTIGAMNAGKQEILKTLPKKQSDTLDKLFLEKANSYLSEKGN